MTKKEIKMYCLLGKDYFTLPEAAFYAGVSESQFRGEHKKYGIHAFKFMGKVSFKRDEIQAAMDYAWSGESNQQVA